MALLDDVVAALEAAAVGTFGTDIFAGGTPKAATMDTAILTVFEYPGEGILDTFGENTPPAVEQPRVQVLARAKSYPAAHDKCRAAYDALHLIANETVNGIYYERIEPLQQPFLVGRDGIIRGAWRYEGSEVPDFDVLLEAARSS